MVRRQSDAGFSLVEMMVVVAIIGLMAGAVVLVMPSKERGLADSLQRTEQALIALSRQSVMTGRVYGARFSAGGFTTQVLTDDGWHEDATILKPEATRWNPLLLSALTVAGSDIDLSAETPVPHIWFLPTSETSEFQLRFDTVSGTGSIAANVAGKIKVQFDE